MGDIEATCENIAVLDEGKVLYSGTVDDLLAAADGKVFTRIADRQEVSRLKKELFITGMHTQGKHVYIRYLSEHTAPDSVLSEPNIEDAYMLYLKENGAELSLPKDIGGEN